MFTIKTLNNISRAGLTHFPTVRYQVSEDAQDFDAILLRSYNMHDMPIPKSLKAVARAGAGVNNIPIDKLTQCGIPVFNTPGANANAVKELVLTAMLMACRNIGPAWQFSQSLTGTRTDIHKTVEQEKKKFVGFELSGKTLGIIGLGAVGVKVANAAIALGMRVVGFDPNVTVQHAWELSAEVLHAKSLDDALSASDFVSIHVPLNDDTKNLISSAQFKTVKPGVILLNFSRAGIVDDKALLDAIKQETVRTYLCDFPDSHFNDNPNIISFPHLGASTLEAEENCAVMACHALRNFLENASIHNSVNFPDVSMPRSGSTRLAIANANVPNMVGQISTDLGKAGVNIKDMLNKSRGNVAFTLIDTNKTVTPEIVAQIQAIEGVLNVRVLS